MVGMALTGLVAAGVGGRCSGAVEFVAVPVLVVLPEMSGLGWLGCWLIGPVGRCCRTFLAVLALALEETGL